MAPVALATCAIGAPFSQMYSCVVTPAPPVPGTPSARSSRFWPYSEWTVLAADVATMSALTESATGSAGRENQRDHQRCAGLSRNAPEETTLNARVRVESYGSVEPTPRTSTFRS